MVEVEFGDFNHGPHGDRDDQDRAMGTPLVRVTMARHGPSELLARHDQGDLHRSRAEAVLPLIMEADVDGLIHCPAGYRAAIPERGAPDAMNATATARPGATGLGIAPSTPVWAH